MISAAIPVIGDGHIPPTSTNPHRQMPGDEGVGRATPWRVAAKATTWHRRDGRPHRSRGLEQQRLGDNADQNGMPMNVSTPCDRVIERETVGARHQRRHFRTQTSAMHAEAFGSRRHASALHHGETKPITIPVGRRGGGK